MTLVTIVACSSQPGVETNQNAANAPVVDLTELEFGVCPYFPTPNENRQQFDPLFEELARQVNFPAKVTVLSQKVQRTE